MQRIERFPLPGSNARMVGYLHETLTEMAGCRTKRPCILVFPGGGYEKLSERENQRSKLKKLERGEAR